jgi:predicted Zn-dependent peptidase
MKDKLSKNKKLYSRKTIKSNLLYKTEGLQLFNNSHDTKLLLMPYRNETQTASIFFYFKVGSKNETLELNGISHFIEHMIFKGSPKFKSYLDISKTFDANGISFNAFTSKDITAYHYKFLSTPENLDIICRITSDMILNPLMREKDITTERNVIIQELKDDSDDIDEFINDTLECILFKGHQLGNPIIGTLATLNNIGRKELLEYHSKYYSRNNLLIAFSGNMKSTYSRIINKYFSIDTKPFKPISISTQGISHIIPYEEKYLKTSINCFPKNLKQDYVHIIFKTKGVFDPLYIHYKILANILGGNMSSRLFVEIREKLGLVYSIKCSITNYEEIGYFDINTQNETQDTIKCIKNILIQLKKIKKHLITEQELQENKKNYCSIFSSNFDDIEYENEYYSKQILFNKPLEPISARIDKINTLTTKNILETANILFDFNKMHIITFGNITEKKIRKVINDFI